MTICPSDRKADSEFLSSIRLNLLEWLVPFKRLLTEVENMMEKGQKTALDPSGGKPKRKNLFPASIPEHGFILRCFTALFCPACE